MALQFIQLGYNAIGEHRLRYVDDERREILALIIAASADVSNVFQAGGKDPFILAQAYRYINWTVDDRKPIFGDPQDVVNSNRRGTEMIP